MRKTSLLVITWMVGAVLAVGLALQGVALVDGQFVENRPNAMSQSAVKAEIRRLAAISTTTATTLAVDVSSSPSPSSAAATTTTMPPTTTTTVSPTTLAPPAASSLALGSAGRPRAATTTTTAATAPAAVVAPPSAPTEESQPSATSSTAAALVAQPPPPEAPTTASTSVIHTFSTAGGSIDVSFDGTSVALASVRAAGDYAAEIRDPGPAAITVSFTNATFRKTIRVTIGDGELEHTVTIHRIDR